ncbi:hypothetical protein KGQ19_11210 [Catenulispora sp. NL8]|uniref:Peptidase inhibitor family I36 n=1 Tax=Catenulispora pinistramenti TaxID=2705254 RepID=A0ABS5KN10_9ACTN|nr:hypothetical protein [Catenulispora pinistramenti]MBS2547440.1 hypothetical protein [Catenulispora pinistramenti]
MRTGAALATLAVGASLLISAPAQASGGTLYQGDCASFSPAYGPGVCVWYGDYDTGAGGTYEYYSANDVDNVPAMHETLVSGNGGSDGAGLPVKNNVASAWNYGSPLASVFCVNSNYLGNRDRVNSSTSDYHLGNGLWHNEASLLFTY